MSVEEQKLRLLDVCDVWHGDDDKVEPEIDRLILETQAAMPCYAGSCREELIARYGEDGEFGIGVGDYVCPSCQARAQLQAVPV